MAHELPEIVDGAPAAAPSSARRRLRLLYVGDAALARACLGRPGGSIEVVEAGPGPHGTVDSATVEVAAGGRPFDLLFIEDGHPGVDTLAILQDLAARKRRLPSVIVAEWDEELAAQALALGASDYVVKTRASFRAVYFRLHRLSAHAALLADHAALRDTHAATLDWERARREDVERTLAETQAARATAEHRLDEAAAALKQVRHDRLGDAVLAARELAQRESSLNARLADVMSAAEHLRQQLAERDGMLRAADARATARQQALSAVFAKRHADLEAALNGQVILRQDLEGRLADAERSCLASDAERRAEAVASAETLAHLRAEASAIHAQLARERDTVQLRLTEATVALEQAHQDRAADTAAAAQHLAEREAALLARIGNAATRHAQLEHRLADTEATLRSAEQRLADTEATLHSSEQRLADTEAALQSAEQRVADTETALRCVEERAIAEQHVARQQAIEREAAFDAERDAVAATREALERQLEETGLALQRTEQQRIAEAGAAEALLTGAQNRYDDLQSDAAAVQETLRKQLAEAEAALHEVRERRASDSAAATARFAAAQQIADEKLAQASAATSLVEHNLAEAIAALDRLEQQSAAAREAAREQAALRQAEFEAELRHEGDTRRALERALAEGESERERVDAAYASRIADAAQRRAALETDLAREQDHRRTLEAALDESRARQDRAVHQHGVDLAEAAARVAAHQQQTDIWLTDAAAVADALDAKLASAASALARAEQQAVVDRQAAVEEAAGRRAEFEARLADEASARQARETELREMEAALQCAEERHGEDMAAAAAELALHRRDFDVQMAQRAAGAAAALEAVEQRASAEQRALAEDAAARQAALEADLAREQADRQALAQRLGDAEAAHQQAEERHSAEMAASAAEIEAHHRAREEGRAQLAAAHENGRRLEELAAAERAERERTRIENEDAIHQLQIERDRLRQSLADSEARTRQQAQAHQDERADFGRALSVAEADLAGQRSACAELERLLEETRAIAEQSSARVSSERAAERAALEALVADRDGRLRDLEMRKRQSDEAAAAVLADVERRLQEESEAHGGTRRSVAQLEKAVAEVNRKLDAAIRDRAALRQTADRAQSQIADMQDENLRRFNHTPARVCRCNRSGVVTHVNDALARLLGYTRRADVPTQDFAQAVFDSGDELRWIVDRCVASGAIESMETAWRRRDGSRVIVRLHAAPAGADAIDLVAEDITRIRVLEEKLRISQRMEAVARYGSEVAVTCHTLLRHVKQEGQQWLAGMESDAARYQGELLLHEVTRAAGFLGQFAAYGNEEKNVPALVDVNRLLRDLAPVLQRVAGDHIELVLREPETRLNLDVEAKRVERILVNVAAYGRERMPLGGRLMIDVASAMVDRDFVAKYPNVRPGPHVLLTVTELRDTARADVREMIRIQTVDANPRSLGETPGVDLGTLQVLVSDCGGHLWMMAEPSGNLVLKIHLPRRVLDRSEPVLRPVRSRWIHRAFGARH